jgi:signal transduction histidine kinase
MRRWISWRQGLTSQFFLFVVLPLTTALVAVALGSQWVHQQAMRAMVAERDERSIRSAAAALAAQVADRRRLVLGLAQALANSPDSISLTTLGTLTAGFDGGMAVLDSDDTVIEASNDAATWASRPLQNLLAARPATDQPYLSSSFVDSDGVRRVFIVARVNAERRVVGAFAPESLVRGGLALDEDMGMALSLSWVLIEAEGNVLFKQGELLSETPLMEHPGVADAFRGESGTRFLPGEYGQEHVVAYAPIAGTPWALLTEEPSDQVEGPLLRSSLIAPLILIPAIILALVVLGFGLRQIVQPLRALESQAADLGQGNFAAIEQPVGGIAEIQRLQAELARMATKVQQAQASLRGYLGAMTAGQEEERRRLARELHDDTVQSLIALDQRAQLAQHAAAQDTPATRGRLEEVRTMTSALIADLRRVIRAMRPIYLEDLGLLPAIEMLARDVETASGIPVAYSVVGPVKRLAAAQEIGLYRIVQEALANAARHARARTIQVKMMFVDRALHLQIHDDGQGFAPPERLSSLSQDGHFGLMGMQERAELIGAQLRIHSSPGQGTTIDIALPT